jgi:hypothetical protein
VKKINLHCPEKNYCNYETVNKRMHKKEVSVGKVCT